MSDNVVVSTGSQYKFEDPAEAYKLARRRITNNAYRRQQRSLDLSNFGLVEVPPEIGMLSELRQLNLSGNRLGRLPAEIGNLKNLRTLTLSKNTLSVFPSEFWKLPSLRFLFVNGNQVGELPSEIQQLSSLRVLDLDDNALSTLPEAVGALSELRDLYVSGNKLTGLPKSIGRLQNLDELRADGNEISSLPEEILGLQKLRILWLSGNRLHALPNNIGRLSRLISIDLSSNELESLPSSIGNFILLEDLDVIANKLRNIPAEIGHCVELTRLSLANNNLEELPPEVRFLRKLTILDVRSNKLVVLTPEVGRLESLTRLYADGNLLSVLPPEIGRLERLQRLQLRSNKLTSLPATVGGLRNLRALDLQNNLIERLPSELGRLKSLSSAADAFSKPSKKTRLVYGLILERNPLPEPFPRLIAPGQPAATHNVLSWLRGELDISSLQENFISTKEKKSAPQEPVVEQGPSFRVADGRYDLVVDIEAGQFDQSTQETLLRRLKSQVDLLRQENLKVGNQYPLLVRTIDEYAALISRPLTEIDVVDVWSVGTSVLAQAYAFEKQDPHRTISEPLEPLHLALLIEVSRLHGGFILGFPTGLELTEQSDRARISPETARLIEPPTSEILSSFSKQRRLLSDRARGLADALEAGLLTASWNTARVGHVSYVMVRNFLIQTGRTIILANDLTSTVAGGVILTAAVQLTGLTPEAALQLFEFMRANSASILSFVAPFPELRAWFEWMINHFDEQEDRKEPSDRP